MEQEYSCVKFLRTYLDLIGIKGYEIKTSFDTMGFLISILIPKDNNEKIGILKGQKGRNLSLLKSMLRIVGLLEKVNPFIIIKLI
jgi:hypothetical protein